MEDPESLYESAPGFDHAERQELSRLEETMCGLLYMQMNDQMREGPLPVELEEETAAYLDGRGEKPTQFDPAVGQQLWNAREIMENRNIPSCPLPAALRNVMEKTLAEDRNAAVPGAIIRLKKSGMEVIKSAFQNVFQEDVLLEATRSVSELQTPRIGLQHRDILKTEYQIIRENQDSVMLNLNLPEDIPGRLRIDLLQNDSVIDSRTLKEDERALNFIHLGVGNYDIVIKAKDTYRFGFVIDSEEHRPE